MARRDADKYAGARRKAAVEKAEEGDTSVYTVTVDTEHIVEFYQAYMASYLSLLSDFGVDRAA